MTLTTYLGLAFTGLVALASGTPAGLGRQPLPDSRPTASLVADTALNPLKIVYFGSSVPYGQGATNKYGYLARYTTLLGQRAAADQGAAWQTVNISVPGDNTVKVLARWQRDLLPQRGRYVVLALSLGNEGIHGGGRPVFEQFRTNLWQLVELMRAQGMVPVVANCYTRNDYTLEDYGFIKEMNLLLHAWAVPSINLLGAVDDGAGRWAPGYWDDALHPNDRGHAELSHALVPSLFDALRAGKALPHKVPTTAVRMGRPSASLAFRPEALVHPFTQVVSFRTAGTGRLLTLQDSTAQGTIGINSAGLITYASAQKGTIVG
ncbi:MAG: SGNH/GDSL hydrolase family protein, partial [Hymenobacter sp.]